MSVSPLKRSASDAQLSNRPKRPKKSARMTMSKTRRQRERGVGERWKELGQLSCSAVFAFGGAVGATLFAAANFAWRGIYAFRDVNDFLLPTHRFTRRMLPPPPPEAPKTPETSEEQPPPPPKSSTTEINQSNHAPTNLHASSSTSSTSSYPQPPQTSSSASSPTELLRASGLESTSTTSTLTSLPNSPPNSKSGYEFLQTDSIRRVINQTNTDGLLNSGVGKRYKRRTHIYEGQHRQRMKEYLERILYEHTRERGYQSDFETFRGYVQYRRRLEEIQRNDVNRSRGGSRASTPILPQDDMEYFQRAVEKANKSLRSPKPPKPFGPTLEELTARTKYRNERIFNRLHPKRKPIPERLPSDAEREVRALMQRRGVVSKAGREQVSDTDLARLSPGQWLNDEVINFYGQLITERAAEAEATKENQSGKAWNVHYFSTFFWPKLQAGYEKGRLAKWTKKVDIFSKDIILMAINHGNAHWTSAAIDFRRKRIISYDSMGFYRSEVYKALRSYLNEEHKNKKKKPFDFTGWEDYRSETYPEQENGYDCGVFTCQTLEHLSRGEEEFNFTQQNMPYLRQRMVWEIGRAKLGDPL